MIEQLANATLPRELSHITETATVVVDSECPMTVDRMLRRLDVVRQRISVRWCGIPGAFGGYDDLHIERDIEAATGCLTFSGRLVKVGKATHTVELVASVLPDDDGAAPRTLVHGTGCTLQVSTTSKV